MLLHLVLGTIGAKSTQQPLQQHQKDYPERYLASPSPGGEGRPSKNSHQSKSKSRSYTPSLMSTPMSPTRNASTESIDAIDPDRASLESRNMEMSNKYSKGGNIDRGRESRASYPPSTSQDHDLFGAIDHVPSRAGGNVPSSEFIELTTVRTDRMDGHMKQDDLDLESVIENLAITSAGGPRPTEQTPVSSTGSSSQSSSRLDPIRLSRIRSKVVSFLLHRFSVHDYTVPRLFIVLPDPASTPGEEPINTYRLYFLCECSPSFTLPLGSGLNHLHIAKHTGYAIEPGRQDEFFRKYGSMVLTLLIFLKYGQDSQTTPDSALASHSKQPTLVQDIKEVRHEDQHLLKRVEKLCSLRRSDLPPAIAQDVDVKVTKMIEFLESFLSLGDTKSSGSQSTGGSGKYDSESDTLKDTTKLNQGDPEEPLKGLVNLADLHELYTYLGIACLSIRLQSGQLGNLFRVSNVRGQVSWVCTYHYRWTFMEKNVDDFARWIVTRGGLFDKPSGALTITLVSRAHTRTFCSWITNKVAPSLIEVHLKLGWLFGKKDLWRLARAIAQSTVTVLSLDGCAEDDDPGYMSIHKKYDPILHLISHGQIHSLELRGFPSLFARISQKTVKAPSLRKLELGPGVMVDSESRGAMASFLSSCSELQELVMPGFRMSDYHLQTIFLGVRGNHALTTLNIPGSFLDDGAAIILAQGLFSTSICHLDLSRNERLTDVGVTRVIRAIGPRLTSLKMSQSRFGDGAAAALAKSMDGISITTTLRNQLQMQHRLDIAALTAGHRPGIRVKIGGGSIGGDSVFPAAVAAAASLPIGHLVYLDIEDNQCTQQGFRELAKVQSRLYLTYLNMAGSAGLEDVECSRILERVASSELRTLRLAFTGFGDRSAKVLAESFAVNPPSSSSPSSGKTGSTKPTPSCQLDELDLQGCVIGSEGLQAICRALDQSRASARLKILDFGHCPNLSDSLGKQLVKSLLVPNSVERAHVPLPAPLARLRNQDKPEQRSQSLTAMPVPVRQNSFQDQYAHGARRKSGVGMRIVQGAATLGTSESAPTGLSGLADSLPPLQVLPESEDPPRILLPIQGGYFTNLRQLDLKSTLIGDDTAWVLAQALVQPCVLLESLTVLEPASMSLQGLCWIVEAMCENTTVTELGIGQSNLIVRDYDNGVRNDYDRLGAALVILLEQNRRLRSLTLIGAPLSAVAKGLLLNQSLHSIYLIRSRGILEDLQLMGQALGFNRSLLVFWMGASDESLLGYLQPQYLSPAVTPQDEPPFSTDQEQHTQRHENTYRNFHMLHQQNQLQQPQKTRSQVQEKSDSIPRRLGALIKSTLGLDRSPDQSSSNSTTTCPSHGAHPTTRPHSLGRTPSGASHRDDKRRSNMAAVPSASRVFPAGAPNNNNNISAPLARNPLIEGIRRNHSLIKVALDLVVPMSMQATMSITHPSHQSMTSLTNTNHHTHTHHANQQHALGAPSDLSETLYNSAQYQQQQLAKKMAANRKLLRDRGRVGWEELKLLGVDDDIIREVCCSHYF
ncbi:hypothetical protein CPC16_003940 [Podila verticillata]|nr:hypothetical protein CPC16_003940 [Podila verticillata]